MRFELILYTVPPLPTKDIVGIEAVESLNKRAMQGALKSSPYKA